MDQEQARCVGCFVSVSAVSVVNAASSFNLVVWSVLRVWPNPMSRMPSSVNSGNQRRSLSEQSVLARQASCFRVRESSRPSSDTSYPAGKYLDRRTRKVGVRLPAERLLQPGLLALPLGPLNRRPLQGNRLRLPAGGWPDVGTQYRSLTTWAIMSVNP